MGYASSECEVRSVDHGARRIWNAIDGARCVARSRWERGERARAARRCQDTSRRHRGSERRARADIVDPNQMSPHFKNLVVVTALNLAFALLVTVHVVIVFGLVRRRPWWRGPVSLALLPFAPYWAWRECMRVRASLWVGALVVYVLARLNAQ